MEKDYKTGSCACGGVQFKASLPFEKVVLCHCQHCQKRTGSAFGLMVYFKEGQISFSQEKLGTYDYQADSGNAMQSHFCKKCGTSLFLTGALNKGLMGVAGGCFDDERLFYKVDREIFCRSKAPFVDIEAKASMTTSPRYGQPKKQ